jgi:hypothetical protein
MSNDIDLSEDDGFVTVTMGTTTLRLDLVHVHNLICDYHKAHKDQSNDLYNEGIVALIQQLGFPPCSQKLGARFIQEIDGAVRGVKKKDATTPASPASTASTPSS